MADSEIIAALNSVRIHLESQLSATNSTIKACMRSIDSKFADLLSTPPSSSPAAVSFPVFRSGGSSSAPQQSRLPTALFHSPGSASPGVPFLSFDVTSVAASTSVSAAPPLFLTSDAPPPEPAPEPTAILAAPPAASGANLTARLEKAGCKTSDFLSTFAPNDEGSKDVDSPDLCKLGFVNITDVEGGKFALGSGIPGSPLDSTPSIAFSPFKCLPVAHKWINVWKLISGPAQ